MTKVLDSLPLGANVSVIRLRSLGDCVLTTPSLQILKSARPDVRVAVVVEPRFSAVFEGNPDVDEIREPSLRAARADLCINFHGGTRSLLLAAASGARWRAAFGHFRYSRAYNLRIPRAQEILGVDRKVHTAEHLASAMFFLGAPRREIPRARLFARQARANRPYAVLHPMAARSDKMWPAERFLEVARHLSRDFDPVFIAGPHEDLSRFAEFRCLSGAPLQEVKSLLSGASLFVGNDSGPAHMAAAFGVPCVVLFGISDPDVWGPWRTPSEVITGREGLQNVTVREVLAAVDRLRVRA
ncbi:MAG: glycosyltransferase family 9 protein [Bryobacteraceae bacterium]|nr:glycosyltransferase family 9 protein [Bryobacteraceae bacterium]